MCAQHTGICLFLCNRKLRPYYIKTFRGDAYLAVRYIMLCIPHQGASKQNVRRIMEAGSQKRAPVYEALEQLKKRRVVPFDVPGHKRGRGNPELVELLGEKCVSLDVNSMKPLDNLCHPVSVIKEAEELAAEAFRADHAFFMVGGTTSSVQSMVLSVCRAGDKIILPRNVHKSVINALVLCGAIPVYVNPEVDKKLGISLGMEISEVERAILENPGAVAGSCEQSDLLRNLFRSALHREAGT